MALQLCQVNSILSKFHTWSNNKYQTPSLQSRRLHLASRVVTLPHHTRRLLVSSASSQAVDLIESLQTTSPVTIPVPETMEPLKKQQQPLTSIPLTISTNSIAAADGSVLLSQLSTDAITHRAADDGHGLILGLTNKSPTARADITLGKLIETRYMALPRTSLWWMTPHWGTTTTTAVPGETQFLLVELPGKTTSPSYALFLPLIDSAKFRATLRSAGQTGEGFLSLRIESGDATVLADSWQDALYVAAGKDPFQLIQQGVATAASLSGTGKPRSLKSVPPSVDVFGWCTWDAFYSKVSASGIQAGLKSLVHGGAPPRWLIIDDGWQQTDVDEEYRLGPGDRKGPSLSPVPSFSMGSAVHEVEEAAAELLAGPGDPLPDQLHGEHVLEKEEEEEAAAAKGSPKSTTTDAFKHSVQELSGVEDLSKDKEGKPSGLMVTLVATAAAVVSAVHQRLLAAVSHIEAWVLHSIKDLLDSSASDSWVIRIFTRLAQGPLKELIKKFYSTATDHSRRLTSIKANAKFGAADADAHHELNAPGGDLGAVVAALKAKYGIQYIYAWHALGAFWGGIGLNDPEMAKYNAQLLSPVPLPGILDADPAAAWVQPVLCGLSLPLNPTSLHNDMHAYLSSCGIDGVKVDVQGTIGLGGSSPGAGGGPSLAAAYHTSLEASVRRHFPGNHLINCMCHSTEDVYCWEDTNLARVSDDFYPARPASFTAHIANCGYNTLFLGEMAVPDYDMFHSDHPAALLHATARAISGGPVYVSDRPGHHNFSLLKRLVLPDGSILRCQLPGRPTADCLFADVTKDEKTALKLWNVNDVNGVVGVFNVQGSSFSSKHRKFFTHNESPDALTTVVRPRDVPALVLSSENMYCLYSDAQEKFVLVSSGGAGKEENGDLIDDSEEEGLEVTVQPASSDVIVISPVIQAPGTSGVLLAAIGLTNLLNAGGAVKSVAFSQESNNASLAAHLKIQGCGSFLAFSSHKPMAVSLNGATVEFEYEESRNTLKFDVDENDNEMEGLKHECTITYI